MGIGARPTVLVVEVEEDVGEVLSIVLESRFGVEAMLATSYSDAVRVLQSNRRVDAIFSDFYLRERNSAELLQFARLKQPGLPFVLVSTYAPDRFKEFADGDVTAHVEKPFVEEGVPGALSAIFGRSDWTQIAEAVSDGYLAIPIRLLRKLNTLPCDVHIRLSGAKFVKVHSGGDCFEGEDHERYESKGVEQLYVERAVSKRLTEKVLRDIPRFAASENLKGRMDWLVDTHAIVHELSESVGFTQEVRELTQASVAVAVRVIQGITELKSIFERLGAEARESLSKHSGGLVFLSMGLAREIGWSSDSTACKLALAGFLHDLKLPDAIREDNVKTDELYFANSTLTDADRADYFAHPECSAQLLRQFSAIPPDVDQIVLQHHESPDGRGFPARLTAKQIAPLSALFIVAHEMLAEYEAGGRKLDLSAFLAKNEARYLFGHFRKISRALTLMEMKRNSSG